MPMTADMQYAWSALTAAGVLLRPETQVRGVLSVRVLGTTGPVTTHLAIHADGKVRLP